MSARAAARRLTELFETFGADDSALLTLYLLVKLELHMSQLSDAIARMGAELAELRARPDATAIQAELEASRAALVEVTASRDALQSELDADTAAALAISPDPAA